MKVVLDHLHKLLLQLLLANFRLLHFLSQFLQLFELAAIVLLKGANKARGVVDEFLTALLGSFLILNHDLKILVVLLDLDLVD